MEQAESLGCCFRMSGQFRRLGVSPVVAPPPHPEVWSESDLCAVHDLLGELLVRPLEHLRHWRRVPLHDFYARIAEVDVCHDEFHMLTDVARDSWLDGLRRVEGVRLALRVEKRPPVHRRLAFRQWCPIITRDPVVCT